MIHRDLCDPNFTKNYSPLRMQFHFVLSRNVCIDGLIPLTKEEIANEMKCDLQSVYKFIYAAQKDEIIRIENDQIYLLKHVPSNDYKEGYIRHYPFLESEEFRELNVQTQRFILYALWRGVYNPGMKMEMKISDLYHRSAYERNGKLNLYSRQPALDVIKEAERFLKFDTPKKGDGWIKITGIKEGFDVKPLQNQGEMKWIDELLVTASCDLISNMTKGKIIELKKNYYNKLNSTGLELIHTALDRVLLSFKLYELESRDEVIPYLRTVLKNLEKEMLPTINRVILNTKQALNTTKDLLVSGTQSWAQRFKQQLENLLKVREYLLSNLRKEKAAEIDRKKDKLTEPFPFYNWLEPENETSNQFTSVDNRSEEENPIEQSPQISPAEQKKALDLLFELKEITAQEYNKRLGLLSHA